VIAFLPLLAAMLLLALPRSVKFEGFTDRGMQHRRLEPAAVHRPPPTGPRRGLIRCFMTGHQRLLRPAILTGPRADADLAAIQ
jgi:hypothetical protein